MIPGVKISMGGAEYEVPPLTLGALRRLQPKIKHLTSSDVTTDEVMDAICEIVHTALSRNYPDMPAERVPELIDLGNRDSIISAVMGGSGLVLGERKAVARFNGVNSMDSSPPPVDTLTQ
jgi:hypothetical protein